MHVRAYVQRQGPQALRRYAVSGTAACAAQLMIHRRPHRQVSDLPVDSGSPDSMLTGPRLSHFSRFALAASEAFSSISGYVPVHGHLCGAIAALTKLRIHECTYTCTKLAL